ncbi:ROK family protein [Clostridium sp. D2Q-11]|uniref:Glucokinase n=1 Tax=Anaeromonas frigoriresistens TaxID=2683708 RepID=A0A942Z7Y5_9FIRM|nr:ROK family protein [Anaeromonas frigoriresistens]
MYIGIDVGGTSIKAGIVDYKGNILYKDTIGTRASLGYEAVREDMITLINKAIQYSKQENYRIDSIGIGVPGIADPQSDNVIYCTNLNWKDAPLGKDLKSRYGLPIYIDNDATVAAIAESVKGITKGSENSVFLTLGTGVGGGIIINRKVYSGTHNKGSEIGHMIIGENFYDCNCGNNGCLETFASATAIVRYTQKLIDEGFLDEEFMEALRSKDGVMDTKFIFDMAKKNNELALKSIDRMVKYLSIGIGNFINILNPDIIAIGGGVSKAGKYLIEKINREFINYVIFKEGSTTEIKLSQLGNDAGIIGAALISEYK